MDVFDRIVMCLLTPQSLIAQEKTEQQRSRDLLKMGFVAAELARSGAAVIVAPVAPKAASRDAIKNTVLQTAGPGGNFFTVHVALQYLRLYADNIGITYYLTRRLRELDTQELREVWGFIWCAYSIFQEDTTN